MGLNVSGQTSVEQFEDALLSRLAKFLFEQAACLCECLKSPGALERRYGVVSSCALNLESPFAFACVDWDRGAATAALLSMLAASHVALVVLQCG